MTCYNAVTYTAKLYNHTIPDKGSQVHMANSYNLYKVESFKAERYILQSLHPMHPSKERVNYHHNLSLTLMLTGNH